MTDQAPELLPDMQDTEELRQLIARAVCCPDGCMQERNPDWSGKGCYTDRDTYKFSNVGKSTKLIMDALTRPPSERPVAQEAVARLIDPEAFDAYLRDNLTSTERRHLSGEWSRRRIEAERKADEILALTAECPEAVRENLTAEEFAQVLPRPEAAVAWLCEYDGHTDATTSRDTMCLWKDTLGRKITPLYAIQHEEPGRETNHSPPAQRDIGR